MRCSSPLNCEETILTMSEPEEEYSLLPVERCTIHPLARIRFDYEVDELAESIRTMGQVQPGRAVRHGGPGGEKASYLIYIGCRRLLACKKASLKHFKAMVVGSIDEGRLQRELLTENVKRANLSVLEELNLLGNYSRRLSSLEELARDLGLSQRLVRARVKLAILTQDKGLVETLYKIERISEYRFTYLHMEKLTALEETKWLLAAVHAAERNWKAEEIESLGEQLSVGSLLQTLPVWGRQFVPGASQPNEDAETSINIVSNGVQANTRADRPSQSGSMKKDDGDDLERGWHRQPFPLPDRR
jgi:ParB/RepB/Spo0J family partition protein